MNQALLLCAVLLLGVLVGWVARALYAAKVFRPRAVSVATPASLAERTIGRADQVHYWQEDGGIWEAFTFEEKSRARMRVVTLRKHGATPPKSAWWKTFV
jgi:hypothetical protein